MATPLCEIMERHGSDKGAVDGNAWHTYTPVYHSIFKNRRNDPLRVFELGIGSVDPNVQSNMGVNGKPGASLRGWEEYFPNGMIYGGDIDEKTLFETSRIKTFVVDQLHPGSIRKVFDSLGELDIIVEDGLHTFEANVCFFENTIENLSKDGIYIIEDILTAILPTWIIQLKLWRLMYPHLIFSMQRIPSPRNFGDNNILVVSRKRVLPPTVVLVGSGFLSIPPPGWGAIESLIWEEYLELKKTYNVHIVNIQGLNAIVKAISLHFPDIVNLHREELYYIFRRVDAPVKYVTNHVAHQPLRDDPAFLNADYFCSIALCKSNYDTFAQCGRSKSNMMIQSNFITPSLYRFSETCQIPDRSIYLASVSVRKRQYKYTAIQSIDFVGPLFDTGPFDKTHYIGEWPKTKVYTDLTKYANLVLLSESECHSCAVIESLVCGLGVVVSEAASAHLDDKPWITIIPNDKLDDITYVENAIDANRKIAIAHRKDIRDYAISKFSVETRVKELYDKALQNSNAGSSV